MSAAQEFVAPSAAFGPLTASSCPKAHFKAVCGVSIGHGLLAINLEAKEHQYVYIWAMDDPEDMGRNHKMSQARSIPLALKKPRIMVGLDSKRGFRQRSRGPTQGPADPESPSQPEGRCMIAAGSPIGALHWRGMMPAAQKTQHA
jgi:hypothetical protein